MTGAMYAAVGGLRSHMSKLNVIGNNIANVNTYGYKAQRMTFKESIYGTNRSGSNGGEVMGGNNPSQTGYGCQVGTIDLDMSPSTYSPTGRNLDCYIAGDGFYLLGDKLEREVEYWDADGTHQENGVDVEHKAGDIKSITWKGGVTEGSQLKNYEMSRVGDFFVDPDGYICNGDNKIVYGFARVQNPDYVPNATEQQIAEAKKANRDIESETVISSHLVPLRVPLQAAPPTTANGGKVVVDADGELVDPQPEPDPATGQITLEDGQEFKNLWEEGDPVYPFVNQEGMNQYADPDYHQVGVQGTWKAATADNANACQGINTTRMPVAENMASDRVSNVMPCQMREMQIGTDGSIVGMANGKTVVIGYLGIASTDNPNGVTHTGGPYYRCMPGAGNMRISTAGLEIPGGHLGNKVTDGEPSGIYGLDQDALGAANTNDKIWAESETNFQSQGLEASSTDLAYEFAEMVTTQRGYQANTRIVTVTDSMLEELVNMKR